MLVLRLSASRVFVAAALAVGLLRCGTEPTSFDLEVGPPEDATGQQDATESDTDARSDAALPNVPDSSDAADLNDSNDLGDVPDFSDAPDLSDAPDSVETLDAIDVPELSETPDSDDGADVGGDTGIADDAADSDGTDTSAHLDTLGERCRSDSDCPGNSWCSDVSGFERCAPRVFGGTEHQMDFVFVPSGTFQQGTPGATNHERPFTATISRNYFVSRTEVTQGQWKAATGGANPSCFQSTSGTSCTMSNANNSGPVERVNWYSTLAYANWLSTNQGLSACYTLTGCSDPTSGWHDGTHRGCTGATFSGLTCTGYRLLTESEWERAARGGMTSTYYWGEATDTATVGQYAWFNGNASSRTQPVGSKLANAYGLFDMSGNVWEWVWDLVQDWGFNWVNYPSGSATDCMGPSSGSARGIRGGSWLFGASLLRSADRYNVGPSFLRDFSVGFRLARTAN